MIRRWGWLSVALLGVGLAFSLVWLASMAWQVVYQHRLGGAGPDFQAGLHPGTLYLTYHPDHHFGISRHWLAEPASARVRWSFKLWEPDRSGLGFRITVIPLWSPVLLCLGAGAAVGRAHRRRHATLPCCPSCGYSMVGLPPKSPCPECGRAAGEMSS